MQTVCVVTCHEYARFLGQCLESLAGQTLPFAKVVVVDDASTDHPETVAANFPGVEYLRVDVQDSCLARNAGLARASELAPEWTHVLHMDADNALELNYHEVLAAGIGEHGFAYPRHRYLSEEWRELSEAEVAPANWNFVRPYDYDALRVHNYIDTCALVRREAALPWRVASLGAQDWVWFLDITRAGWSGVLVEGTRLNYRKHPAQMTADASADWRRVWYAQRMAMTLALVTELPAKETAWLQAQLPWSLLVEDAGQADLVLQVGAGVQWYPADLVHLALALHSHPYQAMCGARGEAQAADEPVACAPDGALMLVRGKAWREGTYASACARAPRCAYRVGA